jgi:hypothetical protein
MRQDDIKKLERAFLKASRVESAAISALPEKPTKAQADRCWSLADETNKARAALTAALDAAATYADGASKAFCACGNRVSLCDHSRRGCTTGTVR